MRPRELESHGTVDRDMRIACMATAVSSFGISLRLGSAMSIDPATKKARVASEAAAGKLAAAIGRAVGAVKEFSLGPVEEELTKVTVQQQTLCGRHEASRPL